uniref:Uncharacterized protein n=1 Tax=Knipowitschia caucasica TaxID=637954 RepID=A0AAV2MHT8_KNICA
MRAHSCARSRRKGTIVNAHVHATQKRKKTLHHSGTCAKAKPRNTRLSPGKRTAGDTEPPVRLCFPLPGTVPRHPAVREPQPGAFTPGAQRLSPATPAFITGTAQWRTGNRMRRAKARATAAHNTAI